MTEAIRYLLKIVLWVLNKVFRANWNIEISSELDSVDSVEACPVQIEKTYGLPNHARRTRCADAIVELFAVSALKVRKVAVNCSRMLLERLICVDKVTIGD